MKTLNTTTPHLIILVGLPGSGKTYFGEQFSQMFSAPFINVQVLDDIIHEMSALRTVGRHMLTEVLKTQRTAVYECIGGTRTERTEIVRLARAAGYTPLVVWPQVDAAVAAGRSVRQGTLSKDQVAHLSKQFSPPHSTEQAIVISGMHTYTTQAKTVLKRLAESNRPAARPAGRKDSIRISS